jgi:tetratricopeptide (TPR) repeat protein
MRRAQELAGSPEADLASAMQDWRMRGELYAAVGAPESSLRQVWESAAQAGRRASPGRRARIAASGGTAAVGLLASAAGDTSAVAELRDLSGRQPGPEVQALLALSRRDSAAARRALSASGGDRAWPGYTVFDRPLAAQAYYLLGEYPAALKALDEFGPKDFERTRFDMRWGLLPRVRLLRGATYERMGRSEEAEREYRLVVSQWRTADPALRPFVEQASVGLGRMQRVHASRPSRDQDLSAGMSSGGQCGRPPVGGHGP